MADGWRKLHNEGKSRDVTRVTGPGTMRLSGHEEHVIGAGNVYEILSRKI
jgi:hypothetical protein